MANIPPTADNCRISANEISDRSRCHCSWYCLYNYVRFDHPFEFGYNYLPEFSGVGNEQFGLQYIAANAYNIFLRPAALLEVELY